MITHAAKGERFIAVSGEAMPMLDIANVMKAHLGDAAKKVPTRQLPNWIVRILARFDPSMRQLLPMLRKIRNATSAKAEHVLGWKLRPREDAIVPIQNVVRVTKLGECDTATRHARFADSDPARVAFCVCCSCLA
jgi:nucleoside-diphosphate-sugar epimerase